MFCNSDKQRIGVTSCLCSCACLQVWGFSVLTAFGMIVIYPNLIAPLFNKFEVLKDQELRAKINALVSSSGPNLNHEGVAMIMQQWEVGEAGVIPRVQHLLESYMLWYCVS